MKTTSSLLASLSLALCLTFAVADSPNLLVNPDFAAGRTSWTDRTKPAQQVVAVQDKDAPGGSALKITIKADGGKNHGQLVQYRQNVKPDATYRVSAQVKSDVADCAYVQVKLMSGKAEGSRFSTGTAKTANEWVPISTVFKTEADTTGIQVLLRYRMNAKMVGKSVCFAALSLVGVDGGAEKDEAPAPVKAPEPMKPVVAPAGSDQYMTPEGAGAKDGSSWANAAPGTREALQAAFERLGPGNTLHIAGGVYPNSLHLAIAQGGASAEKPVRVLGVDRGAKDAPRPVFTGSWTRGKPAAGPTLFEIRPGACFVTLENIEVRNFKIVLSAAGPNHGLRVIDVDAHYCRDAFWIDGGMVAGLPDSGTRDAEFRDCDVTFHTKKGFRTLNGLHHSRFIRCTTDAGGKDFANAEPRDIFSGGFHVLGSYRAKDGVARPDHHIDFIECVANNNYYDPTPNSYWNADGFCAEGATHDLRFIRCEAYGNTDGGWDIKTARPQFIDCVGIGNKRNFRVWTKPGEPVLFDNCLSAGSVDFGNRKHSVGFWMLGGGEALFRRCTAWHEDTCFAVEKGETTDVAFEACLFVPNKGREPFGRLDGEVRIAKRDGTVVDADGAVSLRSPSLEQKNPGNAFDCTDASKAIGYRLRVPPTKP